MISRRNFLSLAALSASGWLPALAAAAADNPQRKRSCILLWMNGGPSQTDTFDLKPGHPNGGPIKEIDTAVPGIRIGEHLPKVAAQMKHMALVRSMSTKEGDHSRAMFLMRTGTLPQGAIEFPTLGSLVAKELANEKAEIPSYISIAPQRFSSLASFSAGFLGPKYAPLLIADGAGNLGNNQNLDEQLKVQDLAPANGVKIEQSDERVGLLQQVEGKFLAQRPGIATASHREAYDQAVRLMKSEATKAFDLRKESDKLRDRYGRTIFGQSCLLARRLVEKGVPFIEIGLNNWDTHNNNFDQVKNLCGTLDPAWATLIEDLKEHGLLDTTLVVWMGEFGRTPKINNQKGRDHFPNAWSTVLCGGGIKGGQVVGKTSKDGMTIDDRPVTTPDLLATVCLALGIDPEKQNMSNVGRPIRIVDKAAKPLKEVLA
jgi:hypothetical protein